PAGRPRAGCGQLTRRSTRAGPTAGRHGAAWRRARRAGRRSAGAPPTPPAPRAGAERNVRARRRGRLAVVYDIDGPRVRLGVGWFLLALVGVFLSPITAALVYGAAAGWAARQVVRAWGSVAW